jgi:hypothetical protein
MAQPFFEVGKTNLLIGENTTNQAVIQNLDI